MKEGKVGTWQSDGRPTNEHDYEGHNNRFEIDTRETSRVDILNQDWETKNGSNFHFYSRLRKRKEKKNWFVTGHVFLSDLQFEKKKNFLAIEMRWYAGENVGLSPRIRSSIRQCHCQGRLIAKEWPQCLV